jgi:hypothetical protein
VRHPADRAVAWRATACAVLLGWACLPAHALRPFDGTDAGVAEAGAVELEIGVSRVRLGDDRSVAAPALVVTYGLGADTEIALEGRLTREREAQSGNYRTRVDDNALTVKHLFRRGSLQDAGGVSIASECSLLLPTLHGPSGSGLTCIGIASQRWQAVDLHLNGSLSRTREHTVARSLGLIVEAAEALPLRPVAELLAERESDGGWTNSALLGLIYRRNDDWAFDVGLRRARSRDGSLTELRVGLTRSIGSIAPSR